MSGFASEVSVAPSWLWAAFTLGVLVLLVIDLSLFGRGNKKNQTKTALIESGIWIAIAICFNIWFAVSFGAELGLPLPASDPDSSSLSDLSSGFSQLLDSLF